MRTKLLILSDRQRTLILTELERGLRIVESGRDLAVRDGLPRVRIEVLNRQVSERRHLIEDLNNCEVFVSEGA